MHRNGAEDRISGSFKDDGLFEVRQVAAAVFLGDMDGEQAGCLGFGIEVATQVVAGTMFQPARIFFKRYDFLADERIDLGLELGEIFWQVKVHGMSSYDCSRGV